MSRKPPSDSAIAGVAVASSVWSTAAMNIGRNTEAKRFRNSAAIEPFYSMRDFQSTRRRSY
jgi:hypothetical protein